MASWSDFKCFPITCLSNMNQMLYSDFQYTVHHPTGGLLVYYYYLLQYTITQQELLSSRLVTCCYWPVKFVVCSSLHVLHMGFIMYWSLDCPLFWLSVIRLNSIIADNREFMVDYRKCISVMQHCVKYEDMGKHVQYVLYISINMIGVKFMAA